MKNAAIPDFIESTQVMENWLDADQSVNVHVNIQILE